MIDAHRIKKDFPIYENNPKFVYLDSTATSLKPIAVINKINEYYTRYSANIFRGVYDISEQATAEYEETRVVIKSFINASSEQEIIFTRNTTESINLFVHGIQGSLSTGNEIATTIAEHHSNFVPWQQLCKDMGMQFVVLKDIDPEKLEDSISSKTKVLTITYVSNVLGTTNPIKEIIKEAKRINPDIIVLVDGAQAVPHIKIDVQDLGCDAFAFSSHKMLGPTGVGVLWVRQELQKKLTSYQYGGEMIRRVTVEHTDFAEGPHRFEAGTPHISGVIALKEAIHYLETVGLEKIHTHEKIMAQYCYDSLIKEFDEQIHIIGPQKRQSGIVAFTFEGIHAHDVAQLLNEDNIAVRAGHHCAMPLHEFLGVDASIRASFYIYNDKEDVDKLVESLKRSKRIFTIKK
ncbi:MAG: cysteine desulfurase [Microgenomates group bacterium]